MSYLIDVESSGNPFAIGVVGARLVHQPTSLAEAVATVRMLKSKGYNYSIGIAQVNHANLARYGLNSLDKAFDPCLNMAAGSHILRQCYTQSGNDWGKAFSCYYSGNFVTGFHDGYVRKIYESIGRSMAVANAHRAAQAIPLQKVDRSAGYVRRLPPAGSAAYRVAIRSVAMDTLADTIIEGTAGRKTALSAPAPGQQESAASIHKIPAHPPSPIGAEPPASGVFVPRVTRLGASAKSTVQAIPASPSSRVDHPAQGRDSAFVF